MKISNKLISALFFSHKNLKFKAGFWTIKNLKRSSFSIWLNTLFIRTLIRAFKSTMSILVYRVEKSKDCNRSGEALSISDLEWFKIIYYLHHSCTAIENPTSITRNIRFFEFRHPKVIDRRKHSFEERTQPLRNVSQRSRAGCTDKTRFNWVSMKLPNRTKKWETRATLNTFDIMSLIKREMKFQNIRLGKNGDHIRTNRRIKVRENGT